MAWHVGIFSCFVLFVPTRIMSIGKFCDTCYKGLEDMLFIAVVLVTSLFYRDSIDLIGLPDYLIACAGGAVHERRVAACYFFHTDRAGMLRYR